MPDAVGCFFFFVEEEGELTLVFDAERGIFEIEEEEVEEVEEVELSFEPDLPFIFPLGFFGDGVVIFEAEASLGMALALRGEEEEVDFLLPVEDTLV